MSISLHSLTNEHYEWVLSFLGMDLRDDGKQDQAGQSSEPFTAEPDQCIDPGPTASNDAAEKEQAAPATNKPSGPGWCEQFPGGRSLDTLKGTFASGMKDFYAALIKAGVSVKINATYRPPERAYLMHYCYLIARGTDPATVAPMSGVAIDWVHKDNLGNADLKGSVDAAKEMASKYQIAYQPTLKSRHTEGLAVDMDVSWSGTLTIENANGQMVEIASSPQDGGNKELHAVSATYGVIKKVDDAPHWSSDGH